EQGAQALDVNVGVPGLDEVRTLADTALAIQTVTELPLQLDSSSPAALERAMRLYNGKPLVNSVNGKRESMDAIFPLVQKYGGVLVCLTLDEDGIPDTAEGRLAIAEKIAREAEKYGIAKKDLMFDPLAMAVSADASAPKTTLDALTLIGERLGAHTVLGVSNVSFGLPNREAIASAFYALALDRGLSAAILNPASAEMKKSYLGYLALTGRDANCARYIAFAETLTTSVTSQAAQKETKEDDSLRGAIVSGRTEHAARAAEELLKTRSPLELIDGEIVPALDEVGKGFEEKRVYLPRLLMSAEAAKAAFSRIKDHLARTGGDETKKCTVVLATVKGDVHDIGKNIVKALLENYSFNVIDLGKDVPPERVAEAVVDSGAPVLGLSALMTTTVPAMEETIALVRKVAPQCRIIVGGAVLTEEYANKIGADAYGKDAMASVRYCERVYGGKA
ncbi:MAG: cobalamin-dependent protein, partial [Candidatus Gallimonas sp.]